MRADSLGSRVAVAGWAVWFYLGKLLWPRELCLVYPRWQMDDGSVLSYLPSAVLVAALAIGWWQRGRTWARAALTAGVCYLLLLLPVLGFVNIYFMRYALVADHYQYAATAVACAVFAAVAARAIAWRMRLAAWGTDRGRGDLGSAGRNELSTVRDVRRRGDALSRDARAEPHVLAGLQQPGPDPGEPRRGRCGDRLLSAALEIEPDYAEAHNNLGMALAGRGEVDAAMPHFRRALQIDPDYALTYDSLGNAMAKRGRLDLAIPLYGRALEFAPRLATAHNNLGMRWPRADGTTRPWSNTSRPLMPTLPYPSTTTTSRIRSTTSAERPRPWPHIARGWPSSRTTRRRTTTWGAC